MRRARAAGPPQSASGVAATATPERIRRAFRDDQHRGRRIVQHALLRVHVACDTRGGRRTGAGPLMTAGMTMLARNESLATLAEVS